MGLLRVEGDLFQVFAHLQNRDQLTRTAALNLLALISERIQQRGQKTDGTLIGGGKYSTRELKSFSSKKGQAFDFGSLSTKKQQAHRLANENDHTQFDGGYKEFRESLGRQTQFVDLTLTGDMLDRGFQLIQTPNGWGLGFPDPEQEQKMSWLTDKYGTVIEASADEIALAIQDIEDELRRALS